jgi:AraC family transcriptional regulator
MRVSRCFQSRSVSVVDYRCDVRPGDKPFTELHNGFSLSYVRKGSFGYHSRGNSYELVTGSILVGRAGDEFVCTHDHFCGDECLSFRFAGELAERIDDKIWRLGCIPPLSELIVLGELAQASVEGRSQVALDEVGVALAAKVAETISGTEPGPSEAATKDRRRAVEAAMWMDEHSHEYINLERVANYVCLSEFYFLRVFSRVLGVTPHQYLIRSRLRKAAHLLANEEMRITDVAYKVGFGDVSNFVRTFRRAAGLSPRHFRHVAQRGQRSPINEGKRPHQDRPRG